MFDIAKIKNLRFFNKEGNLIDTSYDEKLNLLQSNVYLPSVSVNLIENETIYILEEIYSKKSEGDVEIDYDTPRIGKSIRLYFHKNKYKFFTVNSPFDEYPLISQEIEQCFYPSDNNSLDSIDDKHVINESQKIGDPFKANVMIKSKDEGAISDILIIEIDGEIVAEITFHCECVGEDERFTKKLADFGEYIAENEEYIFRNSDISEVLPNHDTLNKKRKEFLIELHNIKPYFSSYKGIINILNLFDYSDLKLKEYWYDVRANKMFPEIINLYEEKQLDNPLNYNPNYKKTTFFGLFYDYNKVLEGHYTEDGLPIVVDNFLFSNDEILIKLFGLKSWLSDREIGGVCTIIDIIGEFVYFNKYNINFWLDNIEFSTKKYGAQPKFEVENSLIYIEDLRPYMEDWNKCELPRKDALLPSCVISNFRNCHVGWFSNSRYGMDNPVGHDEPRIPIGAMATITDHTFLTKWSDCTTKWGKTSHENTTYNIKWNNIGYYQYFDIEWEITHESRPEFKINERGDIGKYKEIKCVLPYSGFYNVSLILHKYNNEPCRITRVNAIEVRTKEADFLSYFRFINQTLQSYEKCDVEWGNVNSHFAGTIHDNAKYTVDENKIKYVTSTLNEYRSINLFNDDLMRYDSLKYDSLDNITWDQYEYHTWGNLVYNKMHLSKFIIKKFFSGSTIQINKDFFKIKDSVNINEHNRLCEILSTWSKNPSVDFQSYSFKTRKNPLKDISYIECVSKFIRPERDIIGCSEGIEISGYKSLNTWQDFHGKDDIWSKIGLLWENTKNVCSVESHDYPFSQENIRIYSDYFDCPILTPVFFTIDNSEMVGKSKCKWTLLNAKTEEIVVELKNCLYFCYTFIKKGQFSLSVEIEDSNGNLKIVKKNKIINIYDTKEFKILENAK